MLVCRTFHRVALAAALVFATTVARAAVVLDDPLSNPPVIGTRFQVNGGTFVPTGWKVIAKNDFIIWHVPPTGTGAVEFDVVGRHAA